MTGRGGRHHVHRLFLHGTVCCGPWRFRCGCLPYANDGGKNHKSQRDKETFHGDFASHEFTSASVTLFPAMVLV